MTKKILSYGDNPLVSTGYGCVWNNLLRNWCKLKPDWEFYHLGWQNRDRAHKRIEGYTMLPMGNAQYGYDTVYKNLMTIKPDFLVTLCDVGWQKGFIQWVNLARQNGWRGKWIMYTPIDTDGWASDWSDIFNQPDVNVAMAQFGYNKMVERKVPNVVLLEHGVDIDAYKPLENREELRKKYNVNDKFVIGFVGRNQIRKMVDRLIMGFANFAKDKDDVLLLLHTDAEPPHHGWSINEILNKFGVTDKVKLTKNQLDLTGRQSIAPTDLNELYNVMDIFAFPTGGEGFGLPAIECQSAGVKLLMADNTTALDLCKEENKIPILKDTYGRKVENIGTNGAFFYYPDDIAMAKMFEQEYNLWKSGDIDVQTDKKVARNFALNYDWENVSKKWIKLFEEN